MTSDTNITFNVPDNIDMALVVGNGDDMNVRSFVIVPHVSVTSF